MISELELKEVLRILKLACNLGLLPADWNHKTKTMTQTKFYWKKVMSPYLLVVFNLYVVFIVLRIAGDLNAGVGADKLLIQVLFLCTTSVGVMFHSHVLLADGDIPILFNLVANFTQKQGYKLWNNSLM
jgi:hypothetical protein